MEIHAIEPYLASMRDEMRHELKKTLSEKLFGQYPNGAKDSTSREDSGQLFSLLRQILEAIKNPRGN